jgi:hypothetical protein
MDKLTFTDIADLGNYMYELASGEGQNVCAALSYEYSAQLLKWLLQYDDVTANFIELHDEEWNNYDKEFYIVLGTDLEIHIEPAYRDNKVIGNDYIDVFLCGKENISEIAPENQCDYVFEIEFDDDDECGDCCEDCSNCPHRAVSESLSMALDFLEHILNHQND